MPLLSELTREASRQINFWEHRASSEPPISGIYLCGGDAHLRGLPEFFARELGLPVERSKIWENVFDLGHYIPPINAHDTLLFATAIGLALRGLNASVL
ncbi:MAG: pilus assembly protein PilM [Candidatus Ryanbacteria bacterium]|nr:pilus assembly protein PilM [Candidatus Ryanbacteria bacterium]